MNRGDSIVPNKTTERVIPALTERADGENPFDGFAFCEMRSTGSIPWPQLRFKPKV